jgi:hypothetical protein
MTNDHMMKLASIAAMKGILSNDNLLRRVVNADTEGESADLLADYSVMCAKSLARKWEEME